MAHHRPEKKATDVSISTLTYMYSVASLYTSLSVTCLSLPPAAVTGIAGSASDLTHMACSLLSHGPPTS